MNSCRFTEDTVLGGKIRIRQPKNGFRTTIDAVLLAAAVSVKTGDRVLELGIGAGGASLCLRHRVKGINIIGIDIDAEAVSLAIENIKINGLDKWISALVGDVAKPLPKNFITAFDHVMLNPPFLPEGTKHVSHNLGRAIATRESSAGLKRWLKYAHDSLSHKGRLTLIHRSDRLHELIECLPANLGAISIFPLWPRDGKEAKRVLVQARKGVKSPSRILPGLTIHNKDGSYTKETKNVLEGSAIIF
ncbi:MAG: methyltransferase [Rhodospirillales bacterium]|nr:methyltransferase [Rhodospirillales bacterium]|tara:strand:- start:427 stop:1167 length:741 start_codon:yes stop_codon:yes gene_type:complete